jgi:hypothetical protein
VLEAVQDQLLQGCPPDAFLAEHRPDPRSATLARTRASTRTRYRIASPA